MVRAIDATIFLQLKIMKTLNQNFSLFRYFLSILDIIIGSTLRIDPNIIRFM